MSIEAEIAAQLASGASASELIARGFKKSTVYKVARRQLTSVAALPNLSSIITVQPDLDRIYLLPGQSVTLRVTIANRGSTSWLISQWGIAPAWRIAVQQWESRVEEFFLRPGEQHQCAPIVLTVPQGTSLGEHELHVGVMGQRVDPVTHAATAPSTEWTMQPFIVHVQPKPRGKSVLVSSTIDNLTWARFLASALENVGLTALVARDLDANVADPTIAGAALVVGFLGHSGNPWTAVEHDIQRARRQGRKTLLLAPQALGGLPVWAQDAVRFVEGEPKAVGALTGQIDEAVGSDDATGAIVGSAIVGALLILLGAALGTRDS